MKNLNKKIILILLVFVIVLWLIFWIYKYKENLNITPEEKEKIVIDEYNFEQLEKVKDILSDIKREDKQFIDLKEFNDFYKQDIQPIKNCYYLRNYKSEDRVPYTFWFKLESEKYINKYWTEYYAYPKYDLPIARICDTWGCDDVTRLIFERTISNPCSD